MKKWLIKISISLGATLMILLLIILHFSPRKTEPFRDERGAFLSNSIATIEDIAINGINQRIVIRGKSLDNPILLHLHGGPGGPDRPLIVSTRANVEDLYTVVYWDQRGAGASYHSDILPETMTLDYIAKDGITISEYLIERFQKDKIYVQGHSWGTAVGITMAKKKPDLFHAYIGIGQMADSRRSEELSYQFALESSKTAGDEESIKALEEIGAPPYSSEDEYLKNVMVERMVMRKYEDPNLSGQSSSMFPIYLTFIKHREYSIGDKLKCLQGDAFSMKHMWKEAINVNFIRDIPTLDIPIYMIQGAFDKHTVSEVARTYFDSLDAPIKQYYNFENSAHGPQYTEYHKYRDIMENHVLGQPK